MTPSRERYVLLKERAILKAEMARRQSVNAFWTTVADSYRLLIDMNDRALAHDASLLRWIEEREAPRVDRPA
jgi:hypothetical protein